MYTNRKNELKITEPGLKECWYHWLSGWKESTMTCQRPLQEIASSGKLAWPFCGCSGAKVSLAYYFKNSEMVTQLAASLNNNHALKIREDFARYFASVSAHTVQVLYLYWEHFPCVCTQAAFTLSSQRYQMSRGWSRWLQLCGLGHLTLLWEPGNSMHALCVYGINLWPWESWSQQSSSVASSPRWLSLCGSEYVSGCEPTSQCERELIWSWGECWICILKWWFNKEQVPGGCLALLARVHTTSARTASPSLTKTESTLAQTGGTRYEYFKLAIPNHVVLVLIFTTLFPTWNRRRKSKIAKICATALDTESKQIPNFNKSTINNAPVWPNAFYKCKSSWVSQVTLYSRDTSETSFTTVKNVSIILAALFKMNSYFVQRIFTCFSHKILTLFSRVVVRTGDSELHQIS